MKSLKIRYEPKLDNAEIRAAADFFRLNSVFEYIDMLNWPMQFPYKPSCQFKIARSDRSIFIHFKVVESNVRALHAHDQDPVSEDSCVAFFCKNPEQNTYFSFEFNCIGTCHATQREGKELNVNPLSEMKMNSIKRISTLGNSTFDEINGNFEWSLTVEIPFNLIDIQFDNLPEILLANFYKCADGTIIPHYLSWSHILTEQPDFHQSGHFGVLNF
jgi:hypothetical protein